MRHPIRIQPYLSPDLHKKLSAYTAARSLTVSAVISAALGEYLERDEVEDAVIVRRLDGVTQVVGQLKRELETLAVGFGTFAWQSFLRPPIDGCHGRARGGDAVQLLSQPGCRAAPAGRSVHRPGVPVPGIPHGDHRDGNGR
jgi:hypothetical protein